MILCGERSYMWNCLMQPVRRIPLSSGADLVERRRLKALAGIALVLVFCGSQSLAAER